MLMLDRCYENFYTDRKAVLSERSRIMREKTGTMTVDLHTMSTAQAKKFLEMKVSSASREIREVEVIHGYHGGTALQQMVRKGFKHPRVQAKLLGLNQGTTILVLK